jgi:DNA repair protein RadC
MKITNTIAEVQITYAPTKRKRVQIISSKDAEKCFRGFWNEHISYKESMYILLLNRANYVLGYHLLSVGGTVGTVADVRVILQLLIKSNAHGFILAHNHPSGNTKPSEADIKLTNKVKEAAELFDVQLLDHLIITAAAFYSMTDEFTI